MSFPATTTAGSVDIPFQYLQFKLKQVSVGRLE